MSKLKNGIKSLFVIAKNKAQGINQNVNTEVKNKRLAECLNCPRLNKTLMQCKECGCFVNLKTEYKQEECPLGKWVKEESNE